MFLTLVMVPAIFFCFFQFVSEGKKIMENERNQMNWLSCYMWMHKEIKRAQNFRTDKETLLLECPPEKRFGIAGIRTGVCTTNSKTSSSVVSGIYGFIATSQSVSVHPRPVGSSYIFTFHNDYVVRTYIQGRIENK